MPLSTRVPIVEFRSLLSPPIQIPIRALQSLYRPRCQLSRPGAACSPQCLGQRRNLVLYKTATAKTVLGMHKVLPFDRYELAPREESEQLINLVKDNETIAQDISLQDVYEKYIRPGQILYLEDEIGKTQADNIDQLRKENIYKHKRTYGIITAESIRGNVKDPNAGKGRGALRVTPIGLGSPREYFKLAMDRSYQFIKHGSPVEFGVRLSGKSVKNKEERLKPADLSSWQWVHKHFPHLRPDFILQSMPEMSRFVVEPVTNGRIIQFVIAAPPFESARNLTDRLFEVKKSVQKSIAKGQQAELPKHYRAQLQRDGYTAYSTLTGSPTLDKHQTAASKRQRETADEATFVEPLSAADRYMPAQPRDTVEYRNDKLTGSGHLKPKSKKYIGNDQVKLSKKQQYGREAQRTRGQMI
jgi:hypothetical protein